MGSLKGKLKKEKRRLALVRQCGDCDTCCTVMNVDATDLPEIGALKPAGTKCSMLKTEGSGCSVYERRPTVCRIWSCVWRMGGFSEDEHPQKIGIMLAGDNVNGLNVMYAYEAREGAFDTDEARAFFFKYSEKTPIALVGRTTTYGPPDLIERMRAHALIGSS